MTPGQPLVLVCSPRRGGNSDTAARLLNERLPHLTVRHLRDHDIAPCLSCGLCSRLPGTRCPLEASDHSAPLLDAIASAPELVLVSPIYFYHLPAQFKALIDRSQPWWVEKQLSGGRTSDKTAHVILIAAREKGERLFEGSLLTIKYWLASFGFVLADPLTLYGLDEADALSGNTRACEAVSAYAARIAGRPRDESR